MTLGQTLIDKASKVCGSDAELARRMGIYPADVSNLRKGKRPLSPELAAELADIAGEDARQAVIDAVVERNMGTKKEGALKEILGKTLAAGVAAMLVFFFSEGSTYAMENPKKTSNEFVTAVYSLPIALLSSLRFLTRVIGRWLIAKLARTRAERLSGLGVDGPLFA